MICSEVELRCSVEWMARMYVSEDREAVEPDWSPRMRQEQAEQTQHMRLKIEREVAEYLARKYGYIVDTAELTASAQETITDVLAQPELVNA